MRTRYDEGWKEIIETFFPQFLCFFFPQIARGIDFGKGYAFLDKELGRISKKGLSGRRVDKLVRVYRKDGDEQWLLVHIEDELWKDVIEGLFPQFLSFFAPDLSQDVDWEQGYAFLDQEFGMFHFLGEFF